MIENIIPTPADEIASTTSITEPTGEPVTNQAPNEPTEETAAVTSNETPATPTVKNTTPGSNHQVEQNFPWLNCTELFEEDDEPTNEQEPADEAKLSPDYLANGFFVGEGNGRYPDPALVSDMAEVLGIGLAICGLKPTTYSSLLKQLKRVNKRTVVFEAKRGALLALRPKIMLMEQKKRAPHILLEIIEANIVHLTDNADFDVCYQHLEAIGAFLQIYSVEKGAE